MTPQVQTNFPRTAIPPCVAASPIKDGTPEARVWTRKVLKIALRAANGGWVCDNLLAALFWGENRPDAWERCIDDRVRMARNQVKWPIEMRRIAVPGMPRYTAYRWVAPPVSDDEIEDAA